MAEDPEDLNYDCNYNLFLAKTMLGNLRNIQDRQKVLRWMRKLSGCNRSLAEMKLRNEFMYSLVVSIQSGNLSPPFNDNPPAGSLQSLGVLLAGTKNATAMGLQIDPSQGLWGQEHAVTSPEMPMLYRQSPDGGAFLAAQPIPKCGAFCYLAVVADHPEGLDDKI
nr:uncharacterized protein LOC112210605 [Halyomorpha halys]